jgi:hypothetical protein
MWLLLFLLTILMSLLELWLFRETLDQKFLDAWVGAQSNATPRRARAWLMMQQWGKRSLHHGMQWSNGMPDAPAATSQALAWMGWSFLILIIISGYSASACTDGCS